MMRARSSDPHIVCEGGAPTARVDTGPCWSGASARSLRNLVARAVVERVI